MTIRTKLTLNVVIVILIIACVAVTSIIGMGFVKSRLQDLTQRSTPFQMRTVEFQRAIQGTTADLVKVATARNRKDFGVFKVEAEKSLSEVQAGQTALKALSGDAQVEAYGELSGIASELSTITEGRLKADEEALAADHGITGKLLEASARLKELDVEIAKLREKGRDLTDQAKTDWDRKMADLEPKRDAARAKLAEVRDSSAEAWKDLRKGAQSAYDDLDKAFRDASREF